MLDSLSAARELGFIEGRDNQERSVIVKSTETPAIDGSIEPPHTMIVSPEGVRDITVEIAEHDKPLEKKIRTALLGRRAYTLVWAAGTIGLGIDAGRRLLDGDSAAFDAVATVVTPVPYIGLTDYINKLRDRLIGRSSPLIHLSVAQDVMGAVDYDYS